MSNTDTSNRAPLLGLSGQVALVHKKDSEGAITIDALSGQVIPGQEDTPEWASGLVCAQLAARVLWYTNRLGEQFAKAHEVPEAYAFEDLDWIGVDEDSGDTVNIAADDEHRMEVLASAIGEVDREEGTIGGTKAEAEISADRFRTDDEQAALEKSQEHGFNQKTGTGE